eukprot:COSAG06_NODE_462_length_15394_cov_16.361164_12_plen_182_part_00
MAAAQPLTTLSGAPASRLAIGGGPETTQLEPGLLPAARAAGVSFLYWASGDKSPAFAQAFKELAASPSRPELFIAANCRTSPEFVREDVTATLRELELDVLDAVVVQYILPEEDGDKVQAALEAAQQLKAEGLVRHVAASTHSSRPPGCSTRSCCATTWRTARSSECAAPLQQWRTPCSRY